MRSSKYTAALLGPIVKSSRTLSEVMRKLGLPVNGGNHRNISSRIRMAGLDTSHFTAWTYGERFAALSPEVLEPLIAESSSIAQVAAKLNLPLEGRPHRELSRRIHELGFDTTHFKGAAWARGETKASHPSVARASARNSFSNAQVFVENSPITRGRDLARRLLAIGWEYRCSWCGIDEWRDKRLILHLDHINGINNDNRLENLRFLCPNCHSQTDTYSNKRRRV